MPKSKAILSESDDSSLESSAKETSVSKQKNKRNKNSEESDLVKTAPAAKKAKGNEEGDEEVKYEIGRLRYVSVGTFRGQPLINIREYYADKSGDMKPSRKGISLKTEQWQKLKSVIPQIDEELRKIC